jgi:acetyl-CoA carboxylase carboxyl transferase subunit alpha
LWKNGDLAPEAAARLKITAPQLLELGIVDSIVDEPPGGAHQDHDAAAKLLDSALYAELKTLSRLSPEDLRADRYDRFRKLGAFVA